MNKQWQVNDKSPSPKWILDIFHNYFDPCPINPKFDGLSISWKKLNYVNPPFNKKVPWIDKAIQEQKKGNTTVMLLPHDTRAVWYADKILPNCEILMFRGNFNLDNGKHTRYGMILAIFNPTNTKEKDGIIK